MNKLNASTKWQAVQCHVCHYLCRLPRDAKFHHYTCPRCHVTLKNQSRKNSIEMTWALLLAATIMFVPANTMPIMSFYLLGQGSPSTIMEGVIQLWGANQWPLAVLVFLASIVVPILKILVISFLLFSIQFGSQWQARAQLRLYKFTEFIGRWSMVDIFVVAILVGIVQFGSLAHVEANVGSLSFACVVILTMLAARTLNAHLIWDHPQNKE